MAVSIETLKLMDDAHAINALRADFDPLTSTPLETFLVDWIESRIDDAEDGDAAAFVQHAAEFDIDADEFKQLGEAIIGDADNTVRMLDLLIAAGIDTPEVLSGALDVAKKFQSIADDAGDLIERVNGLLVEAVDTAPTVPIQIKQAESLRDIGFDMADVFDRLNTLITETQEV